MIVQTVATPKPKPLASAPAQAPAGPRISPPKRLLVQPPSDSGFDCLTGLPDRRSAEAAIVKIVAKGDGIGGVLSIRFLAILENRYGRKFVDHLLTESARKLTQRLPSGAALFRWADSAFFLGTTRSGRSAHNEMLRCGCGVDLDQYMEVGRSVVFVPVVKSFDLCLLSANQPAADLFTSIDNRVV